MDSCTRRDRLRKEKQQHFLGTASIRFGALNFDWCRKRNPLRARPDQKNVASLETMFRHGCDWSPELVSHQIPALIDPSLLEASLERTENSVSLEALKREGEGFVKLDFADGEVICLKGEHRVIASDATVANRKKRWIVRLYSTALSEEARNDLADERASDRHITDEEYTYNITLFWLSNEQRKTDQGSDQGTQTSPWYVDLERKYENKAKALNRLWRGPSSQRDCLKRFHEIPALFWGISLGNVGKIIAMPKKQTENQIRRVFKFWNRICGEDSETKLKLDMDTVKAISGRGSGVNGHLKLANSGEILRNFDATERAVILSRLQFETTERVAPTLGGIFQNTVYLRSIIDCLMHLVPHYCPPRDLWTELDKGFEKRRDGHCLLQIAYRQLWLFALREFPSLPRNEKAKKAGAKSRLDEAKLFEFAVLAHRLGCRTDQITNILQNASWKPAPTRSVCTLDPDIESKPYKHGKPHPEDLERYKSSLFLLNMHKPFDATDPGSSFFLIQRSLYLDMYPEDRDPEDTDPEKPEGIDLLLERAPSASEYDLIDDEYRPGIQRASEELTRGEQQLRASISELQRKHDKLQQGYDSLLAEGYSVEQQINTMEAQRLELENNVTQLESDVNAGQDAKERLEKDYQDEWDKLLKLRDEVARLEDRKTTLESEIQKESRQAESLRETNTAHSDQQQQIITMKAQRLELEKNITQLESDVKAEQNAKERLGKEYKQTNAKLLDMKSELVTDTGKLLKLRDEVADLQSRKNTLESEIQEQDEDFASREDGAGLQETGGSICIHSHAQKAEKFPIELRKKIMVYKEQKELKEWLEQFVEEGYSMVDRNMKTLVPHSCFKALVKEEEEDRLIILFKRNFLYSEVDFTDKAIVTPNKRKRIL